MFGQTIGPGDCARGDVAFQTPNDQHPAFIVFSSSSTIKWEVS